MKFDPKTTLSIIAGPLVVLAAFMTYGWPGVAMAVGAGFMWALLHFTRLMHVLKKAATRPKGWVASAVMLNARLQVGQNMLDVVRLTSALGHSVSPLDATGRETWQWRDDGNVAVTVWFCRGKTERWDLERPVENQEQINLIV